MTDVCMQSDWVYYKQTFKLLLVKVNHVCEDFIPILEWPSLVFHKQKWVFLCCPYSEISDAVLIVIRPSNV